MAMYFVSARDDDGDSLDLFIAADTVELAKMLWMAHYSLDDHDVEHIVEEGYINKLSYHKYGPNQVIPWEDLERVSVRRTSVTAPVTDVEPSRCPECGADEPYHLDNCAQTEK